MAKATCSERNGRLVFSDGRLELVFDQPTGRWLGMRELATRQEVLRGGEAQAPVVISVGGVTTATKARHHAVSVIDAQKVGAGARYVGHELHEGSSGPAFVLKTREGDWLFEARYSLPMGKDRVDRSLRLQYLGQGIALLRDMEMRVPPAWLGPWRECFVEAPGYPTRPHQQLSSLTFGEPWKRLEGSIGHKAPGWLAGVFAIDNPGRPLALTFWAWDEQESCSTSAVRVDTGTRVSHLVDLACRFRAGTAVEWEGEHIQLTRGYWHEALERFQCFYDEIGWRTPSDMPEWAKTAHIYNCYVGRLSYSPGRYPDHDALIADLPRIKELGFDVVYTMPHVPYPGYDSEDYMSVEKQYGSADGVRRLAKRAHELGMRVMLDVGIHGVVDGEMARIRQDFIAENRFHDHPLPDRHPDRDRHPEWFMQTEFGTPAATYTWCFDHANQGMRDYLVEALCLYVRDYDVDAFRIDAPTWIPFPNWAEGLPYRASASIYGSVGLFEQARKAVHAFKPAVAFYSEAPGPVYARGFDLLYNYDYQWLFSALLQPKSDKGYLYTAAFADEKITAADMAQWLEQLRLAKPPGTTAVHHLDSGDTFGWSNMQYRREVFGVAAARALFGVVVAIAGPIMMYARAEDGMEGFYRSILAMKRSLPALDRGDCDFTAASSEDPRVFTLLRVLGEARMLPVINIADRPTTTTLTIEPARLSSKGRAWQVVDRMEDTLIAGPAGASWLREQLGRIRINLGPFQVRFLEIVPV